MAVFPPYDPVYSASKNSEAKRQISKLGDGYESSTVFGLNRIRPEWTLQWVVEKEIAEQIEGFLQARADAAEAFEWQPPDSSSLQKWKCEEWVVSEETYGVLKIDATFIRIFEITPSELNTVATTCVDEICESDYGDYTDYPTDVLGDWDVWVARLRGTVAGADNDWYMSCSYTFDDGYIYMSFVYGLEVHVAKFQPSGKTVWVKRYPGIFRSNYYPGNYVLHLAADEKNNSLFLGWQVIDDFGVLFPTQFTAPMAVMAINTQSGDFKWGTYFCGRAVCSISTPNRQGQFFQLVYDNQLSTLYFRQTLGGGTIINSLISPSTGVLSLQIEQSGLVQNIVENGFLGTQKYSTGYSIDANILPLYVDHHSSSPATQYYFTSIDISATGTQPLIAKFLGNGQLLAYFRKGSSGYDEIMIIGANRQIIDHVRLPIPATGFAGSFPSGGSKGDMPSIQYVQVLLIPETKKLYLLGQGSKGPGYTEFSVSMSGSLVTSINAITSMSESNVNISLISLSIGATKYSPSNNTVKRITCSYGKQLSFRNVECSLYSINRSMLSTNGVNVTFNAGQEASDLIFANTAFYVNNTEYQVLRTNLKGVLTTQQSSSGVNTALVITPDKNSCTGQASGTRILAQRPFSTTPQDMTGALIFDLYTYKQPTAP